MGQFEEMCPDCVRWNKDVYWRENPVKNRSIYQYNEGMKAILNQFKFRGDYELVTIFGADLKRKYKREYASIDIVSYIPLSSERLNERGFNQAEALATLLGCEIEELLIKRDDIKQSKKNRKDRLSSENPFIFTPEIDVRDKQILLIDDIYTTGITLRHAAKVLIQNGASKISSLTLIRS
ncbi:ComF family protein [Bacillus sp. AK128]